jgi:hypothetical protein
MCCTNQIKKLKVTTEEEVAGLINSCQDSDVDVTKQHIEEIVRTLVLDYAIMEVKSNGMAEFASIPIGKVCCKCISKEGLEGKPKAETEA